jgi:hypothetical protein
MTLGSAEPLTEMSTRSLPAGKGWPSPKADNLTAICEPIFSNMWEPRHLTTCEPSRIVAGINLPFLLFVGKTQKVIANNTKALQ